MNRCNCLITYSRIQIMCPTEWPQHLEINFLYILPAMLPCSRDLTASTLQCDFCAMTGSGWILNRITNSVTSTILFNVIIISPYSVYIIQCIARIPHGHLAEEVLWSDSKRTIFGPKNNNCMEIVVSWVLVGHLIGSHTVITRATYNFRERLANFARGLLYKWNAFVQFPHDHRTELTRPLNESPYKEWDVICVNVDALNIVRKL